MPKMHETARRLYQAASRIKGVEGPSAVGALLGEKPQTIKNWESRGVSESGKVKARERIGCDTYWLSTGEGTMEAQGSSAWVASSAAPSNTPPTLALALEAIDAAMAELDPQARRIAVGMLAALESPGSHATVAAMLGAAIASGKRRAA